MINDTIENKNMKVLRKIIFKCATINASKKDIDEKLVTNMTDIQKVIEKVYQK